MPPRSPRPILIRDVAIVDVVAGVLHERKDLELAGGRIVAIRAAGSRPAPAGARIVAGGGLVALPGLIDAHVHSLGVLIEGLGRPWDVLWFARQMRSNLRAFLRSGVTTVRDMGAPTRLALRFARQANDGSIPAPRMLVSGGMICAPGGYPYFIPPTPAPLSWLTGVMRYDVDTVEAAERAVDRLADAGVDVIKSFWSSLQYDDARTPLPNLRPEVLEAMHRRAATRGLPLAVHHTWYEDLKELLELPFDSLEHLPIDRPMSDAQVARIVERRLPVTSTLMSYGIIDHLDELEALVERPDAPLETRPREFIRRAAARLRRGEVVTPHIGLDMMRTGSTHMRASLAKLHAAGARVVLGTDSGGAISPCGLVAWELEDMARAGLPAHEILRSATVNAAEVLRRPDLGRLEPGTRADVVLLGADPLADVSAVRDVRQVVKGGRCFIQESE